jgi:hypothetical protein
MAIGTRGTVMQMQKKSALTWCDIVPDQCRFWKRNGSGSCPWRDPTAAVTRNADNREKSVRQAARIHKKNEMSRGRPEADQVFATATQPCGGIYFASVVFFTIVCGEMNSIEL